MQHIGIIMDGNARWAKEHGAENAVGYQKGAEALLRFAEDFLTLPLSFATVYAFSTENMQRDEKEVSDILRVIAYFLRNNVYRLSRDNRLTIRFIGNRNILSPELNDVLTLLEEQSYSDGKTLLIAVGYGGKDEICRAVNKIIEAKLTSVDEKTFSSFLDTAGIPDPECVIRYGGNHRLSNFLPLQTVYSELFFTDKYWPDYDKRDIIDVLEKAEKIKRNLGKQHG